MPTMIKEQMKDIEAKLNELGKVWGVATDDTNLVCIEEPHHAGHPTKSLMWVARVARAEWIHGGIDQRNVMVGKVAWDVPTDLDELSDFDWSFTTKDYEIDNRLWLCDDYDSKDVADMLGLDFEH